MGTGSSGKAIGMFSFVPKFLEEDEDEDDLEGLGEFIFVLDRSGSMSGTGIRLAREAAVFFLKSLPSSCRFNIVSFGSSHSKMFPEPVEYNDENLNKAVSEVSSYQADMGGTEIYSPLQEIFNHAPQFPRSVFLLTDGEVGDA
jgi:uncharacterized protein with von Willebrand factor type A (vWA) domain